MLWLFVTRRVVQGRTFRFHVVEQVSRESSKWKRCQVKNISPESFAPNNFGSNRGIKLDVGE